MPRCAAARVASSSTRCVRVKPGMTLFTVMPWVATSLASVRAKPVTAARTALLRISPSTGCLAAIDVTLTMRPQPRACMPGRTPRTRAMTLCKVVRSAWSHAASSCCWNGPAGGPPALVTRMSTPPCARIAASSTAATPAAVATSATTAVTGTPCAARIACAVASSASPPRAQRTSDVPSAASASADARPNPLLEAATSATRPRMPRSIVSSWRGSTCRSRRASRHAGG